MSDVGVFSVIPGNVDGRPLVAMIDTGLRELPNKGLAIVFPQSLDEAD